MPLKASGWNYSDTSLSRMEAEERSDNMCKVHCGLMYVCMYVCMYACMYVYTHTHTYIYIYIHTYIHTVHTYTHIYTYIYIHTVHTYIHINISVNHSLFRPQQWSIVEKNKDIQT